MISEDLKDQYVVEKGAIFEKSEISKIGNHVDWGYGVFEVFLPDLCVSMTACVKSVEMDPWALKIKVFIVSKTFIITFLQFKRLSLRFPNKVSEIIQNSISRIWPKLNGMTQDIISHFLELAISR